MSPTVWEFAYGQKLSALHNHALQISSAHALNEIAEYTLDALESGLGFVNADITVAENGCLRRVGYRGSDPPPERMRLDGRGVAVKAANTKSTIRIRDTRNEAVYVDSRGLDWKGSPRMLSELAVPVLADGESVAVLNVESDLLDEFTNEDQQLMETLASHVGSAITRIRYEEELKLYSTRLETLVEERTRRLQESERELRSAKERMDYLVVSNPAVIYSGKPLPDLSDWVLTYVSDRVVSVLGYSPEDFMSGVEFWRTHVHPDGLRANPTIVQELWRKGQLSYTYQFQHKDGDYRWIREEAIVTRDENGRPIEVNGYWVDVTERRRLEEELRASRERLEYIITSNPALIFVAKPLPDYSDFYAIYLSKSSLALTGFESEKLTGEKGPVFWASRVHPDDLAVYNAGTPEFWKQGHRTCEYRFLHKNGTYRWIHEETQLVRDAASRPAEVIGYWTDVTELKQMTSRLAEAERLAGVGETAAMVGHDLRNPLQGIAGAVYLLRTQSLAAIERTEMLETIQKCVDYSDGIVNDLLDYARTIQLTRVESTPKRLVASALEGVRIPSEIEVNDQTVDQPLIAVDQERMKRVLVNLIENAKDAMPNGGALTLTSKESDGFVEIAVSDTGAGLPEIVLENLWKPLQTTKSKGMGLGLAICKRIIDAHDGRITVESKQGEGTTFNMCLPSKGTT